MTIEGLLAQFLALGGVGALIPVLVNILKAVGVAKDGDAPIWVTGLNLLGLNLLFIANVTGFNFAGLDPVAGQVAQVLAIVVGIIVQVLANKKSYETVRGLPVIGYSHTLN